MKFFYTVLFAFCLPFCFHAHLKSFELSEIMEDIIHDIYRIDADELREYLAYNVQPVYVDAEDLQKMMATDQNMLVINVLSANWYEDCHIAGSINVPLKELVQTMKDWDRNQSVVVYCALDECDASEKAYILLHYMGFSLVLDYKGGIKEWLQLGYPVTGPCASDYLHQRGHKIGDC